jgi:tetratricopeptide (TPR) repeat protein
MKKSPIIIILLLLVLSAQVPAQPIFLGEEALNQGDYRKAQEYFNQIIENTGGVEPFELALAYYYRSWTWIKLYGKGPGDITSVVSDPSGELLLNAYNDLISSLSHEDGRLTKRINDLLVQLEPGLLQYGLVMINRAEDYSEEGRPYVTTTENAVRFLDPAARINSSYLAYDLLGQAYMLLDHQSKAIEMIEKAIARYKIQPPETPDFMIGYAFFRLATIYRDTIKDEDRCLDVIHEGKKLLDSEHQRFLSNASSANLSPQDRSGKDYIKARNDLHTLELETLLRSSTKLTEAQAVFKSEMALHPGDVDLIIAYASLFEKTDPEVAIEYYKKALKKDPGNPIAEFNLAVVYYNQGNKYFDAGLRAEDEDKQDLNIAKAQDYFVLAKPFFLKYFQSNPGDQQAISALKMISFALDDLEAYEYYSSLVEE